MGMRYRRPNRRKHAPYPAPVQIWAVCLFLGLVTGVFSYGWGLLFFILLASAATTTWNAK